MMDGTNVAGMSLAVEVIYNTTPAANMAVWMESNEGSREKVGLFFNCGQMQFQGELLTFFC